MDYLRERAVELATELEQLRAGPADVWVPPRREYQRRIGWVEIPGFNALRGSEAYAKQLPITIAATTGHLDGVQSTIRSFEGAIARWPALPMD